MVLICGGKYPISSVVLADVIRVSECTFDMYMYIVHT